MKTRNPSIEFFRVLMVLGICWLHAITTCLRVPSPLSRVNYFLYPCVVGFVFITGWFGVSFSLKRLMRLYGTAVYCGILAWGVNWLVNSNTTLEPIKAVVTENWFLKGYVVVILCSPIVNLAVRQRANIKQFVPPVVMVFGWSFLACAPHVGVFVPQSPGLTAYSGITLLGIYLVARLINVYGLEEIITNMAIGLVPVSLLAIGFHYGSYASPFSLILMATIFLWFKNRPSMTGRWNKVWLWMSPSLLSVFLLHASPLGFSLMTEGERCLLEVGVPIDLIYLVVACTTFAIAFILDLPRRYFVVLWKRFI